ncbi:TAXI family TRAP transporter solute-binding subunit [Chloroflexota bacterium]
MKRSTALLLVSLCLILLLVASNCAQPAAMSEISIGTQPIGTALHTVGVAVAKVISEHSELNAVVKPFAGTAAFSPMFERGEIHIGYAASAETVWAYTGDPEFPVDAPYMRLVLTTNYAGPIMGLIVRKDSDIRTVADLRGKRVSADFNASVMSKYIEEIYLRSGGLTWDDVVQVPVANIVEGWNAFNDRRVDATMGGSPTTPKVVEMNAAFGVRPLPLEENPNWEEIRNEAKMSVAEPRMGKAGMGILTEDVRLMQHPFSIISSSYLDEEVVKEIVQILWENYEELQPLSTWLASTNQDVMTDLNPGIPYHEGTVSWFKEKKLWTEELDAKQKQLLKLRGE